MRIDGLRNGFKSYFSMARMMKLVDIPDLKSGAEWRAGSTPAPGTNLLQTVPKYLSRLSGVLPASLFFGGLPP